MTVLHRTALCLALALGACSSQPAMPPPPAGVVRVAVAPPDNRTGHTLTVSGMPLLDRLLGTPKVEVPQVLHAELVRLLVERGFPAEPEGGDLLAVRITAWDPEIPTTDWVSVSLEARLTSPDGATRWEVKRTRWLVATRGAPTVGEANGAAARAVAAALVGSWTPAP